MKKVVAALFMVVVLCTSLSAFDIMSYPPSVEGGDIIIDVGAGWNLSKWGGWENQIPPIYVDVDYLIPKIPLSVGLGVAFSTLKYDWDLIVVDPPDIKQTLVPIMFRAMWHWGFDSQRLDFYTGFNIGYQLAFFGGSDYDPIWDSLLGVGGKGLYWNVALGLRYYFGEAKKFGLKAELGYPLEKIGLSIRL